MGDGGGKIGQLYYIVIRQRTDTRSPIDTYSSVSGEVDELFEGMSSCALVSAHSADGCAWICAYNVGSPCTLDMCTDQADFQGNNKASYTLYSQATIVTRQLGCIIVLVVVKSRDARYYNGGSKGPCMRQIKRNIEFDRNYFRKIDMSYFLPSQCFLKMRQ